jgi:hypothetical protein
MPLGAGGGFRREITDDGVTRRLPWWNTARVPAGRKVRLWKMTGVGHVWREATGLPDHPPRTLDASHRCQREMWNSSAGIHWVSRRKRDEVTRRKTGYKTQRHKTQDTRHKTQPCLRYRQAASDQRWYLEGSVGAPFIARVKGQDTDASGRRLRAWEQDWRGVIIAPVATGRSLRVR